MDAHLGTYIFKGLRDNQSVARNLVFTIQCPQHLLYARYLLACTLMCLRASLLDLPAGATTVDFVSC